MIGLPIEYKENRRICIVCEGYEEKEYVDKLNSKAIFSEKYEILPINAKGISNVFPVYQEKYQSNSYHLVLMFCDTDKVSRSEYLNIKKKINEQYDNDVADDLIIFGNPTTMQIILSHFRKVEITSQAKGSNRQLIEQLTGIENYDAKDEQIKDLMQKINRKNYETMKQNLRDISTDDTQKPSTNILKFLDNLENDNTSWIDEINKKLV
ncbi:MAG: hypothetical protein HFJ26_00405 [Clostridia bacterium]|nr:hypothetical protein [Clostridia bacterium]